MKILIVSEFFPTGNDLRFSGGVEARNFYVARELANKHKVTILTSRQKDSKESESLFGIDVIRLGKPQKYHAASSNAFARLLFIKSAIKKAENIEADIVEGTNFVTHFIARQIAAKKNIPSVAWYPDVWVGSWFKNAGVIGIFGEILERINLKRGFDAYIAISSQTKSKLLKFTDKKIFTIACGIDQKEFAQTSGKKDHVILSVARLTKYKNIKNLILAYALLSKEDNKLSLTIVGRGPQEKELKTMVKNLKLKKVSFISNLKRQDLVGLYKKSELFCLPSVVEGFGISVIESAAANTPYVVSDNQIFKEVTENFQGGLSSDANDPYDIKQKLASLLRNKPFYLKKQKEGSALSKLYSWGKIAIETEKVYKSLI